MTFTVWFATYVAPTMKRFNWHSDHTSQKAANDAAHRLANAFAWGGLPQVAIVITVDVPSVVQTCARLTDYNSDYAFTKGTELKGLDMSLAYETCMNFWQVKNAVRAEKQRALEKAQQSPGA